MLRAVLRNVRQRRIQVLNHAHCQDQRQKLGIPVARLRPHRPRHQSASRLVPSQLDLGQLGRQLRQELFRHLTVTQQRL